MSEDKQPASSVAEGGFEWLNEVLGDTMAGDPSLSEAQRKNNFDAALARWQRDKDVADGLLTPQGQIMLETLREQTEGLPLLDFEQAIVHGAAQLSSSEWAYYRAGQNSIYHYFLRCIEAARRGPPKDDQPEEES